MRYTDANYYFDNEKFVFIYDGFVENWDVQEENEFHGSLGSMNFGALKWIETLFANVEENQFLMES